MSLDDFIKLTLDEKANFVWKYAVFLDNYIERDRTINLYYYKKFYIEITVAHHGGKVLEILGFKSLRRLDKYLRKIELRELI